MRKSDLVLVGALVVGAIVTAPMWAGPLKRSYVEMFKKDTVYEHYTVIAGDEYVSGFDLSKEDCLAMIKQATSFSFCQVQE